MRMKRQLKEKIWKNKEKEMAKEKKLAKEVQKMLGCCYYCCENV